MKALQVLVVVLGLLNSTDAKGRRAAAGIKFNNITSTFNPKNSYFFSFSVAPDTNGRKFDIEWNISSDIRSKLMLGLEVYLKRGNSLTLVFPYEFEYCRIWDGFMSQTFARMWFKNLKRFGKFPTYCPILKGYYFINRMFMEKGSVPSVLLGGDFLAKVVMYINKAPTKDIIFNVNLDLEISKE